MRRFLLLFVFTVSYAHVQAQVFQAEDIIFGAGNGAAVYYFTASDTAGYRASDEQGGINLMFRAEYGLASWLSIEATCSYTGMITETLLSDATCSLIEVGPGINYHVPWKNRWIDLSGGIGAAVSFYSFNSNDQFAKRTDADGLTFYAGVCPRLYFTKRQRLGGNAYYRASVGYYGAQSGTSSQITHEYSLATIGHSFGLGLFYRFGKPRTNEPADPNETK